MAQFVITGTGTDIGKTVFAAGLTGLIGADYWQRAPNPGYSTPRSRRCSASPMTCPQYSSPPLVVSANSAAEIASRSLVKPTTWRMYPSSAGRDVLPYSNSAIWKRGAIT